MSKQKKESACIVGLITLGIIFFYKTFYFDFFNIDDHIHTSDNIAVLTYDLKGLLFKFYLGLYYPLSSLSLAIDWWLGGPQPWLFHLNNFICHLLSALILFKISLKFWPKKILLGFLISLTFLLHPLKAESVVWITERKDVLSGLFLWLTIYIYLIYLEDKRWWKYILANITFFLALSSKVSVVPLALFFLVIDWYRNKKIDFRSLVNKAPFALMALFFVTMNIVAQSIRRGPVTLPQKNYAELLYQFQFYLEKAIFPWNLRVWYTNESLSFNIMGLFSIILVSLLAILIIKRSPAHKKDLIFGLSLFLLFLSPNLKLVPFGDETLVNDRYMYIALTGLSFAFFPFILNLIKEEWEKTRRLLSLAISFLFVALLTQWLYLMHKQIPYWRDPIIHWRHAAKLEPNSTYIAMNLGKSYFRKGRYEEALLYFQKTKGGVEGIAYLGLVQQRTNREAEAENTILDGLKKYPGHSLLLNVLGAIKLDQKENKEALALFTQALSNLQAEPSPLLHSHILNNLGLANLRLGYSREAESLFRQAIAINSYDSQIIQNLKSVIENKNR